MLQFPLFAIYDNFKTWLKSLDSFLFNIINISTVPIDNKKIHFKIKNCFIFFENNIDAEKTFDQRFIESFQSNLFVESVTENLLVSNFLFTCQYIWYSKELYRKIECVKHYFNKHVASAFYTQGKEKNQHTAYIKRDRRYYYFNETRKKIVLSFCIFLIMLHESPC